jgi:DNA-binding Xre family transcriptional regulator
MAEAADFSMPNAFAKDYLDKIIKKTGKSLNNTYILYTGKKKKIWFSTYTVLCVC